MNAVQGSNREIKNEQEYSHIDTSCAGNEAEVNGWPDEERLQHMILPKRNYRQKNRVLMADRIGERLQQPELAKVFTDLKTYGEMALNEPLPPLTFALFRQFSQTGERKAYENAYFDRRGRLAAVAMLALVSDEPRVLHTLEEMLWAVCDEYTWCLTAHLGNGEARQVEGNIDLLPQRPFICSPRLRLFTAGIWTLWCLSESVSRLNVEFSPRCTEKNASITGRRQSTTGQQSVEGAAGWPLCCCLRMR